MFSKLSIVASLLAVVTATHTITAHPPPPTETTVSQCNTGSPYCCQSAGVANTLPGINQVLSAVGAVIDPVTAIVGLTCTSIAGNQCTGSPVCCTDNEFKGLIVVGCNSINL